MAVSRLIFVLLLSTALLGCKEELYSGLRENEVNEMVSILLGAGVSGAKKKDLKTGTFSVLVDGAQFNTAIELLKASGYPKERFVKVNELFKNEGLISSPLEERVRYIFAIAQDVQDTLSRIDGVVTARVHVVLPENDPFVEKVKPSSASVFIKYLPDRHLEDIKAQIKLIVEKSIEGLSYDKVSVIMLPADEATLSRKTAVQWVDQWGVRVAADSAGRLRFLVGALVAAIIALSGVVLVLVQRLQVQARTGGAPSDGAGEPSRTPFQQKNVFSRFLALFGLSARNE